MGSVLESVFFIVNEGTSGFICLFVLNCSSLETLKCFMPKMSEVMSVGLDALRR